MVTYFNAKVVMGVCPVRTSSRWQLLRPFDMPFILHGLPLCLTYKRYRPFILVLWVRHFSKNSWFLLVDNGIWKPMSSGCECLLLPGCHFFQQTEPGNVYMPYLQSTKPWVRTYAFILTYPSFHPGLLTFCHPSLTVRNLTLPFHNVIFTCLILYHTERTFRISNPFCSKQIF
jgi:hypothetical protein